MLNYNNDPKIPERMMSSITRYVEKRIPMGNFLTAVFSNDLKDAVLRADNENITLLPTYIRWLYNHAPSECYGSLEKVKQWIKKGV